MTLATGGLGEEVVDPILGSGTNKNQLILLYDPLVGMTPEGLVDPNTGLAEKWEISHGADSSSYTFYLRKGVKFHNGDEVTAEDVKFSLERVIGPRAVSTYAGSLKAVIKSIEVVDRYTVRIGTKTPYAWLAYDLSIIIGTEGLIVPKKYIEEKGGDYFATHPVGSGPYRFVKQVGGSYIQYEAVDDHWRVGVPKYKTVYLRLVPEESTRVAMLKRGEADIIMMGWERATELVRAGFNLFPKLGAGVVELYITEMWRPESALHDKRVREALNLGINREDIRDYIFAGGAEATSSYISSGALGYKPQPPYPYDPGKAKELLKEAGYPPGTLEITIYSYPRSGVPGARMLEAIAGYWSAVGIKAKLIPTDYAPVRSKWAAKTLGPNVIVWVDLQNRPLWHASFRATHHSKSLISVASDPELDALIENLERQMDAATYGEAQGKLQRYFRENHLIIPVVETSELFAASRKITEWKHIASSFNPNLEYLFTRR